MLKTSQFSLGFKFDSGNKKEYEECVTIIELKKFVKKPINHIAATDGQALLFKTEINGIVEKQEKEIAMK